MSLEKQSQEYHSNLWTFPIHEKSIEGFCGCNSMVTYVYSMRIATFNQALFDRLFQQFLDIHEHNVNDVFMTLFEQTVSELQLSRLVHSEVLKLQHMVIFEFI